MTGPAAVAPQERREALAEAFDLYGLGDAADLVESWLAEKDAEIERLTRENAALRGQKEGWHVIADEMRRRTAKEIKRRVSVAPMHHHIRQAFVHVTDVNRICDEVGGSE